MFFFFFFGGGGLGFRAFLGLGFRGFWSRVQDSCFEARTRTIQARLLVSCLGFQLYTLLKYGMGIRGFDIRLRGLDFKGSGCLQRSLRCRCVWFI